MVAAFFAGFGLRAFLCLVIVVCVAALGLCLLGLLLAVVALCLLRLPCGFCL